MLSGSFVNVFALASDTKGSGHRLLKWRTGYCHARGLELGSEYEIGFIISKKTHCDETIKDSNIQICISLQLRPV